MATLTVADFGNPIVNGNYTSSGTKDGEARYVKDDNENMVLEYREEYGPYNFSGAYYLILTTQTTGSIPLEEPLYKVDSNDPTDLTWVTMQDQSAGSTYNGVGTVS